MGLQFATIISVIAVITGTQCVFLMALWLMDRRIVSLGWWAAAFGVLTLGCGLTVWQSFGGPLVMGVAGAALGVFAFGLIWQAVRIFDGRLPRWPVVMGLPSAWFAVIVLGSDYVDPKLAVISAALLVCVFLVLALREVVRGRREALHSRRPLAIAIGVVLASILLQVFFDLGPGLGAHGDDSLPYGVWLMLAGAIAVSTAAVLALGMARERQQRTRDVLATLDPQTGALSLVPFLGQAARLVVAQLKAQAPVTYVLVQLDYKGLPASALEGQLLDFHDSFMANSRATDMVARVRPGAFAIVLPNIEPEEALPRIQHILHEARGRFEDPGGHGGLPPRARVGLAGSTEVGHDLRALMLAADAAMDEAVRAAADGFVIYSLRRPDSRRDLAVWPGGVIVQG